MRPCAQPRGARPRKQGIEKAIRAAMAELPGLKGPVMLSQVATLEVTGDPAVIGRLNRSRNINFEVELSGVTLGDAEIMDELFASAITSL